MEKKDIVVAVHGNDQLEGGVYNVLASFSCGLLKGFQEIGVNAYSTYYCSNNNINFNLAIGFNTSCLDFWQKIMSMNITNIMWSVDSVFAQNFNVIKQFLPFEKFIVFEVTPADNEPVAKYLPSLRHGYIPHATDMDLWKNTNSKKEIDIVYFSSIIDYEKNLEELKQTMPELVFKLMMQMLEITMQNPKLSFWQICQALTSSYGIELDTDQYLLLFQNVSTIAMYEQKVKMIQALSDFNVQIYGNGPWEKYIKGKVKHAGSCNVVESVEIMNKAKISLHCHPMQLALGIHERILNASAVSTFSLVSDTPSIKAEFGDSFGYFNHSNFDDIADKALFYLSNEDERLKMAQQAYNITKERHTWASRAKSIMEIIR